MGVPVGARAEPDVLRRPLGVRGVRAPARRPCSRASSRSSFNALANYALIFGKFGLPALGIVGSGLATTLSQTLMLALLVAFSLIDPRMRRLRLFALPWRFARDEFAALWRLGLPIGATIAAEVGVFSAATLAMGLLGPATLEAHTIALQIASLAFMVPLGLGQAATVRIGRAYGARDRAAIARAGARRLRPDARLRGPVRRDDDRRAEAADLAVPGGRRARRTPRRSAIAVALLRIAAIFQVFDASQATLANMLRGLHDSRWPLVIALFGYWGIGAPVGVALGFATPLGGVGVWIGLARRARGRRAAARRALAAQGAARLRRGPSPLRARRRRSSASRDRRGRRSRRSGGGRSPARIGSPRRGRSRCWR